MWRPHLCLASGGMSQGGLGLGLHWALHGGCWGPREGEGITTHPWWQARAPCRRCLGRTAEGGLGQEPPRASRLTLPTQRPRCPSPPPPRASLPGTTGSALSPPSSQFGPECGAPGRWVLLSEPVELGRGDPQAAWAPGGGGGHLGRDPHPVPPTRAQTPACLGLVPYLGSLLLLFMHNLAEPPCLGGCSGQELRCPHDSHPRGPCLHGVPSAQGRGRHSVLTNRVSQRGRGPAGAGPQAALSQSGGIVPGGQAQSGGALEKLGGRSSAASLEGGQL